MGLDGLTSWASETLFPLSAVNLISADTWLYDVDPISSGTVGLGANSSLLYTAAGPADWFVEIKCLAD